MFVSRIILLSYVFLQIKSDLKGHLSQVFLSWPKYWEKPECTLTKFEVSTSFRFQDFAAQN